MDPWAVGHYTAADTTNGGFYEYNAKSWFTVPGTELTAAEVAGRVVIIHGLDGGRIACAVLVATPVDAEAAATAEPADGADWHAHDGGFSPLQALELDYLVARSRTLWLFALDELLLAAGWGTAAYLAYTSSQLSSRWGHLSVVGAVVSVFGFLFAIARMFAWRPWSQVYLATAVLVDFLILPVWILWLALQLRTLSAQGGQYAASVEMARDGDGAEMARSAGTTKRAEADANAV